MKMSSSDGGGYRPGLLTRREVFSSGGTSRHACSDTKYQRRARQAPSSKAELHPLKSRKMSLMR